MVSHARRSSVFPNWLVNYDKQWLRPDVIAGLTAGAVVIPKRWPTPPSRACR